MALFNTLRTKGSKILVIALAFSMIAFILTDFIQSNPALLGGESNEIGEIQSESITFEAFQAKVDQLVQQFARNNGVNPSGNQMDLVREQAWQEFIIEYVFHPQYEKLAIELTDAEKKEMIQGENIHPQVRQAFSNPQTGVFEKDRIISTLRQIKNLPPQQKIPWLDFENSIAKNRLQSKYENLMTMTNFVNKYERKVSYMTSNSSADISYLFIPFFSIPDSIVSISEVDLETYLEENADKFKKEESKNLIYVAFDIVPSSEDTTLVRESIVESRLGLQESTNDSLYASIETEGMEPYKRYTKNELPPSLEDIETIGYTTGPIIYNGYFKVLKLVGISEGDEYFLRARHILFKSLDESEKSKKAAQTKAQEILNKIKQGSDFAIMASIYGTDGTKTKGGDLGWFGENGGFVEEFKTACFSYKGVGLIPYLVETEFGYHIIEVTEEQTNITYNVAQIEKELYVSDKTENEILRTAELFALESKDLKGFNTMANERGYTINEEKNLQKNDNKIGSIAEGRKLVFWLFNEASEGDISPVEEVDGKYIVAAQSAYQKEGLADLNTVRNQVTREVTNGKKADYIIERLNSIDGTISEIAKEYGPTSRTGETTVNLNAMSIPNVGYSPDAVGITFSLDEGEATNPFPTDNGVLIIELLEKNIAQDQDEYDENITSLMNKQKATRMQKSPFMVQGVYDAIINFADIEDNRYKFF